MGGAFGWPLHIWLQGFGAVLSWLCVLSTFVTYHSVLRSACLLVLPVSHWLLVRWETCDEVHSCEVQGGNGKPVMCTAVKFTVETVCTIEKL